MLFRISLMIVLIFGGCTKATKTSLVNPAHLDHLYNAIKFNDQKVAYTYIYSDYPAYNPVGAVGEGVACVDDVARSAIFYFRYYERTSNEIDFQKAKSLIRFILNFQAENGFYYNFIKADNTINKVRINSQAKADWWSWRGMWAIAEAMQYAKKDSSFYNELDASFIRSLNALEPETNAVTIKNIPSDQASVLLIALTTYFEASSNNKVINDISLLAHSIMSSQRGDKDTSPFYAFMSWKNEWHGWGNSQAYALLKAGQILNDPNLIRAAQNEIKYFYPFILSQYYLKRFELDKTGAVVDIKQFEQIAYAIRPMVWASLELYHITKDTVYALQAGKIAAWLFGENIASKVIYDPGTGRCYDGINAADDVNLNSGAESTIESLLVLIELEKNPIANIYLQSVYRKSINE